VQQKFIKDFHLEWGFIINGRDNNYVLGSRVGNKMKQGLFWKVKFQKELLIEMEFTFGMGKTTICFFVQEVHNKM
jgi:hypothetical protein